MKVFCDSVEPIGSKGSFRILADGFNSGLAKIGALGTKEDCDIFLLCTSCDTHLRHPRAKTGMILAWETTSPAANVAQNLRGTIPIAISNQVADTYRTVGINMPVVNPGINADFWKPTKEKFDKTTFICNSSSNTRGGHFLLIPGFGKAFSGRKNIRLIVKDRPNGKLEGLIERTKLMFDVEIIYDKRDLNDEELRDLYSQSHFQIYPTLGGSFCFTIGESLACETPNVATNGSGLTDFMKEDFGHMIDCKPMVFNEGFVRMCEELGISNSLPLGGYTSEPHLWLPSYKHLVELLKKAEEDVKSGAAAEKGKKAREFLKNNFSWEIAARNLIKVLEKA